MADTLNLLIIEDHPVLRATIDVFLMKEGHTITCATDIYEAKLHLETAKASGRPFDAILCDFWLEHNGDKTPGTETYALVREHVGPDVPLLCASSDIGMWERVKKDHEDERMYTRKKIHNFERDSMLNFWDEDWVKTTLAEVKNLPPLAKKLPGILLAGKDPSFLEDTTRALEEAGYQVAVVDTTMAAADHLLPRNGSASRFVAVISGFELANSSAHDLFLVANMRKSDQARPFIATGENLEQWATLQKMATASGLTLHLVPQDPAKFLTKLKELGV